MRSKLPRRLHTTLLLFAAGALLLLSLAGCNSEPPATPPTLVAAAATPEVPTPAPTPTMAPTSTAAPTATPAVTTTITPTAATPTPLPTPISYIVQDGDTLIAIATEFGVNFAALLQANGLTEADTIYPGDVILIPPSLETAGGEEQLPVYYARPGDSPSSIAAQFGISVETLLAANPELNDGLQIGQPVIVPFGLGQSHYTVPGDTLLGIAIRYGVSLDELAQTNADKLNLANLDLLPVGIVLDLPQETVVEGYDCNPQPPRNEVIIYTVKAGERLLCLSRKFGVSMTTILYANLDRIVGEGQFVDGVEVLIPPAEGTLYIVSENEEAAAATTLQDLMTWYDVQAVEDIRDWSGNQATEPFTPGQPLFIRNGDLLSGPFRPPVPVAAVPQPPAGDGGVAAPPAPGAGDGTVGSIVPSGDPPPGGLWPIGYPWSESTDLDAGYCQPVDGGGWSGSLSWPIAGRQVNDNRGFRPGHTAIDINANVGTPVYAAESGTVVWAGFSLRGFGNLVVLAHGNTWQTFYAHMSEVFVSCGQAVGRGTQIGLTGQTGAASWPHLHFEVRFLGFSFDPMAYLP